MNKLCLHAGLIAVLFFGLSLPANDSEPLLTFILAGQSNMKGKFANVSEIPNEYKKQNEKIYFFNEKQGWQMLKAGETEPKGFGPEISFAFEMAKSLNKPIGIIKHSVGGTNLYSDWNPTKDQSEFTKLVTIYEKAKSQKNIKVVGMLWQQGGADAKKRQVAKNYLETFEKLITTSRAKLENDDLIFVSGRLPKKDEKSKPHWGLIREAHESVSLKNYAWVDCDSISIGPDNVHFDAKGMIDLGKAFAEKMVTMLTNK